MRSRRRTCDSQEKLVYQQGLAYPYKGIPKKSVILPVGAKPCF